MDFRCVHLFQFLTGFDHTVFYSPRNIPCKTFLSNWRSRDKSGAETGMIASTELPSLVPIQSIDNCVEIHILHEELCDLLSSNDQNCPLLARLYQCVFCKGSMLFWFSSRCRNFGPWVSWYKYCACPIPLFLAALKMIHDIELAGASRCSGALSATRFSTNSSNHSGRSRKAFPRTLSLSSFSFGFLISADLFRCHSCSHFLLMRDAVQEWRLPAVKMSEM